VTSVNFKDKNKHQGNIKLKILLLPYVLPTLLLSLFFLHIPSLDRAIRGYYPGTIFEILQCGIDEFKHVLR